MGKNKAKQIILLITFGVVLYVGLINIKSVTKFLSNIIDFRE